MQQELLDLKEQQTAATVASGSDLASSHSKTTVKSKPRKLPTPPLHKNTPAKHVDPQPSPRGQLPDQTMLMLVEMISSKVRFCRFKNLTRNVKKLGKLPY